jgi:hypothetical protein
VAAVRTVLAVGHKEGDVVVIDALRERKLAIFAFS